MPNCHRARVSGARARSTSSFSLRRRGDTTSPWSHRALCPFNPTDRGRNRGTLVNAFTFTSNYGAHTFGPFAGGTPFRPEAPPDIRGRPRTSSIEVRGHRSY